ncbi:MAG: hypothetical protein CR978_02310 [Gammaproteobacteria bacterium]|nr:MAG: hypothetical protein CR978_02310 [Gammaproteobacteria bacterium]
MLPSRLQIRGTPLPIACHECDLLIDLPEHVPAGTVLSCPRCDNHITAGHKSSVEYVIALSISALICLLMANAYPYIAMEVMGQEAHINLFNAALALYAQGFVVLGVMVLLFILLFPALYLLILLALLIPLQLGLAKPSPTRIVLGKLLSNLQPWVMSEVFLIGVLVALIKLFALASISLHISFWAYVAFVVLFTYISGLLDIPKLWRWVECHS